MLDPNADPRERENQSLLKKRTRPQFDCDPVDVDHLPRHSGGQSAIENGRIVTVGTAGNSDFNGSPLAPETRVSHGLIRGCPESIPVKTATTKPAANMLDAPRPSTLFGFPLSTAGCRSCWGRKHRRSGRRDSRHHDVRLNNPAIRRFH